MNRISAVLLAGIVLFGIAACKTSTNNNSQGGNTAEAGTAAKPAEPGAYQQFAGLFKDHSFPLNLPQDAHDKDAAALDKKYLHTIITGHFNALFGEEEVLPAISDNMEQAAYYPVAKMKLDSFDAYFIHKQAEDDYYYMVVFDSKGNMTDGACISFTEGNSNDGTVREASISFDGSIEIFVSQYDVTDGARDKSGAERHFFEITPSGKIHDMKNNSKPKNA